MSQRSEQPSGLISVLLDVAAEFGDRDDAAMDLGEFDDPAAEQALAKVACDLTEDEGLADTCGQSLAEIWCRRNRLNKAVLMTLSPAASRIAIATIEAHSPVLGRAARELLS